jgi:hypothetical protein
MHLVQTRAHITHCEVGMEFRVRISIDATLYPEDLISLPSNFNFRTFDAYTGGKKIACPLMFTSPGHSENCASDGVCYSGVITIGAERIDAFIAFI